MQATSAPPITEFSVKKAKVAGMVSWVLVHDRTGRKVAGGTEKQTREQLYAQYLEHR